MGMKKIEREIDKLRSKSWSDGFDHGYDIGFEQGVAEKNNNVIARVTMAIESYVSQNKFSQAKVAKEILEFLQFEYDEEKALENYQRDLENEGW